MAEGPARRRPSVALLSGPQVSLDPSTLRLTAGSTQSVQVVISDVVNLYGFQLHINFDPAVIQINALTPGTFLSPDIVLPTFDNINGYIDVGISQKSPSVERSGSGVLLFIDLQAIASGDAEFEFESVLLASADGISLGGSVAQPDIIVLQDTATPTATPMVSPTATATPSPTPGTSPTPTATIDPSATPYFYLEPATLNLAVGQTGSMQIRTSYVQELAGVGVRMRWDPTKVQVVDALPGEPGVQVAPGDLFSGHPVVQPANGNTVDNGLGDLSYALLYMGDPPGPTGQWTVAAISFTAQMTGSTLVEFYGPDTLMTDAGGVSMPIGWINGQVIVGGAAQPTATPTQTPTQTPIPTVPAPTATPTAVLLCSDRIQNGSFEQLSGGEAPPWVKQAGTTYEPDILPHTGSKAAYLGGYDGAQDGIYQTVTIPADAVNATLRYWWYLFTVEPTHPHDYFYVEIYDTSGTLQEVLSTLNDGAVADQWQQATHNLMAYAGQTIRISFRIDNNESNRSSFYVDDISLEVCTIQEEPTETPGLCLPLIMDNFVK